MKNKKTLLIIALAFVLVIGGAAVLYRTLSAGEGPDTLAPVNDSGDADTEADQDAQRQDEESSDAQGDGEEQQLQPAPDFTVYDSQGGQVNLSDFIGKPVVLNFWASWCGPCKQEMPHFEDLYKELGGDVHFLMVNSTGGRETMESAKEYLEGQDYTFPVYFDTDYDASATYGVYALPTTYFVDAEGYLVAYASGALDEDTLRRGIDMIHGE